MIRNSFRTRLAASASAFGALTGACILAAGSSAAISQISTASLASVAGATPTSRLRRLQRLPQVARCLVPLRWLPARDARTPPAGGGARRKLTPAEQKGLAACASLRPKGGFGAGRGGFNPNNPAFAKLQACLKQHGVKTTGSGASRNSSAFRTAFQACRSLLPPGGFGPGGATPGGGGANTTTFARYQACLKQHGVVPGAGGQSPSKLQKAITACHSVLSGSKSG